MAFLEGTVKVPGVGQVKKTYAAAGVAVVGVLAVVYYRSRHGAAAPAAAGTIASGTDPYPADGTVGDPTDLYSTDPATGITYGDEQAGFSNFGGFTGSGGSGDGSGGGSTGDGSAPPFTTNAQWSAFALAQLVAGSGKNPGPVTDALGLYVNGQAVSDAQKVIIDDAIAVAGPPPVAGPAGFPPSIRMTGSSDGGKTYAANPVTGIHASGIERTDATVSWHPSPHATYYTVKITTGKITVRTQDSTTASSHIGGLKPGTKYDVTVLANPARPSAHTAHVSFTTQKAGGKVQPGGPNQPPFPGARPQPGGANKPGPFPGGLVTVQSRS